MTLTDEQLTDLVVAQQNERTKYVAREAVHELKLLRSQVSAVREWAGKEIEHAKKAMVNHFDPTSRAMAQQERDTLREVLRLLGEGE